MSLLSGVKSRFTLGTNEFGLRSDLSLVASMIEPETRLLDVGCGDGALLDFLVNQKECDGRGMELSQAGVSVARMAAHITYLSEPAMWSKFGRSLQDRAAKSYGFDADFQVESYLRYQGASFVDRFDANAYLYITRAMDYFDLVAEFDNDLARAYRDIEARFLLVSFTSDWLFPTSESKEVVRALNRAAANVSFVEIESDRDHDAATAGLAGPADGGPWDRGHPRRHP
jgi:hypothetical protein